MRIHAASSVTATAVVDTPPQAIRSETETDEGLSDN